MNGQHKKLSLKWFLIFAALGWVFPLTISAQTADTLKVTLDMRTPINEGWLDTTREIVGLRGDHLPLSWGNTYPANDFGGDGIYTVSVPFKQIKDSLMLSFKIKVDGINNPEDGWQKGLNHSVTIYTGRKNQIKLKWEDVAKAPPPTITGQVEIIKNFNSSPLLNRNLYIYLPPNYKNSNKRYPVLYMHDGRNIFDASASGQEWKVDETAESLIKQKIIEPIIIVGIGNTKNRIDEYTPSKQVWKKELRRVSPPEGKNTPKKYAGIFITEGEDTLFFHSVKDTLLVMIPGSNFWQSLIEKSHNVFFLPRAGITFHFHGNSAGQLDKITADKPTMGGKGDIYGDFLIKRVKPFIDKNYRTKPEAGSTMLGGSSLGGLISLYLGLKYPDKFSGLLVVSPSVWWDNLWILNMVKHLKEPTNQKIWIDIGTGEGNEAVVNVRDLKKALLEKGWPPNHIGYLEAKGAVHNERAWAKRVPEMLRFLFATDNNKVR